MMAVYLGINAFFALGASFIAPIVQRIFKSAKKAYNFGCILSVACMFAAYFFGKNATVFTVLLYVMMVGYTISSVMELSVYADAVDYSCNKYKTDTRGFLMSMFTMPGKFSTTFAGAILGFALGIIQFNKAHVTAYAAGGIRVLMSALPGGLMLIALILMMLYPEKKYIEAKKLRDAEKLQ